MSDKEEKTFTGNIYRIHPGKPIHLFIISETSEVVLAVPVQEEFGPNCTLEQIEDLAGDIWWLMPNRLIMEKHKVQIFVPKTAVEQDIIDSVLFNPRHMVHCTNAMIEYVLSKQDNISPDTKELLFFQLKHQSMMLIQQLLSNMSRDGSVTVSVTPMPQA